MKRIGLLTSGGDCQALNAAMRGVVKGLSENVEGLEVYGFLNGYKGLIYGNYRLPRIFPEFSQKEERSLARPDSRLNRCGCRMKTVWIRSRP